jgi:hypothetical protein
MGRGAGEEGGGWEGAGRERRKAPATRAGNATAKMGFRVAMTLLISAARAAR